MKFMILLLTFTLFITPSYAERQNGDINCDDAVNIFDVTGLISYLYLDGQEPCNITNTGIVYERLESYYSDGMDFDPEVVIFKIMEIPTPGVVKIDFYTEYDARFEGDTVPSGAHIWIDTIPNPSGQSTTFEFTTMNGQYPYSFHIPISCGQVFEVEQKTYTFYIIIQRYWASELHLENLLMTATYFEETPPVNK